MQRFVIKTLSQSLRENKKPALLTLLAIVGEVFFEVLIPFFTADVVNMIKAGAPLEEVTALGGVAAVRRRRGAHLRRRLDRLCPQSAARHVRAGAGFLL